MRSSSGIIKSLAALAVLMLASALSPVQAETLMANLQGSPLAETPPITNLNATGGFNITIEVTRDSAGNITGGKISFIAQFNFPGAVEITGLHIHEGATGTAGPVRFDSGISGSASINDADGVGVTLKDAIAVDPVVLARLLANPRNFYVNLHTRANPGGALRAQFTSLTESLSTTVAMSPAQEVPPITGLDASGTGTLTFNPTRNAQGVVNGGNVTFTVDYNFPGAINITGLHIHEQVAGQNGSVVINTAVGGANTIVSSSGKGFLSYTVPITTAAQIGALTRLLANPTGFYVNLHTSVNPGGAIRGQLTALSAPPVIAFSNKYIVPTGNASTTVTLSITGLSLIELLASMVQINGQTAVVAPDLSTGNAMVTIPASALANAGVLNIQVKAPNGTLSLPLSIPVVPAASLNSQAVAVVDAASFRAGAASESIAAAFGTKLASTTVVAASSLAVLPTVLDGTTVYINGVNAPLFFVSAGQVNFQIPVGTISGPAAIVVVAKDGSVSQGQILIGDISPGIFTRLTNGQGAPAAVASTDNGVTFPIAMSNPDGTPVEVSAGNIIVLFGTGFRFRSGEMTATAGGVTGTPSFVGAAPGQVGVDQINLTIPQSMAGKGEMDLVFTVDGKMTNAVRIKVR